MKKQQNTEKKTIYLLQTIPETEQTEINGGNGESSQRELYVPDERELQHIFPSGSIWINNHNETLLVNEEIDG